VNAYENASEYVNVILPHLAISDWLVVATRFNSDCECLCAHEFHFHYHFREANSFEGSGIFILGPILLIHLTFNSILHHRHL